MDQSNQCIHILRDIITQLGPPSDTNIGSYTGLMEDLLVDYPREKYLLKLSLEQGFVIRLIKENQTVPMEILIEQIITTLYTNYGIDKPAARWSIETWALALDISVPSLPISDISADFSCDKKSGLSPVTICFTPTYVNDQAEYFWSFGDGDESYEQNPYHEYCTAGTFSVSLRVSQGGSVREKTEENSIEVTSANVSGLNDVQKSKDDTTRKDVSIHEILIGSLEKDHHFPVDLKNKWVWIATLLLFSISVVLVLCFLFPQIYHGGDISKTFWPEKTQNLTSDAKHPESSTDSIDPEIIPENLKKIVPLITAWKISYKNADYKQLSYDAKKLKTEISEQKEYFDKNFPLKYSQGDRKKLVTYYLQFLQNLMGLVKKTEDVIQSEKAKLTVSEYNKKILHDNLVRVQLTLKDMFDSCSDYPGKCGAEDSQISTIMNFR